MTDCLNCDSTGWVCENHADKPWDGESGRSDACGCGAGSPCNCVRPPLIRPYDAVPFVRVGHQYYKTEVVSQWDWDDKGREVIYSTTSKDTLGGSRTLSHYIAKHIQQDDKITKVEYVVKGKIPHYLAMMLTDQGYLNGKGGSLWQPSTAPTDSGEQEERDVD